jgi:hypothetical protein
MAISCCDNAYHQFSAIWYTFSEMRTAFRIARACMGRRSLATALTLSHAMEQFNTCLRPHVSLSVIAVQFDDL